ncbi:MAG: hypothetical protein OET90_03525 [Desulfuromonadales bacterium]|nr:hypothetical protein [Desulfuromonadales bacterium]
MRLILIVLVLSFCASCAVKVTPVATPTATVNMEDNSITDTHDGVTITVKLDALSVAPYIVTENVTSFLLTIDNRTEHAVSYPSSFFVLKDGGGYQFNALAPERVREIVSKDTVYLIPYPYVGYYYLHDQALMTHSSNFASTAPFYAEYHPQDIYTRALPETPILKQSKVSGVVYYLTDLEQTDRAEIQLIPDTEISSEPLVRFPFIVEK